MNRRNNYTLERHWDKAVASDVLVFTIFVLVILSLFGGIIGAAGISDRNAAVKHQAVVAKYVYSDGSLARDNSESLRAKRRKAASSFLAFANTNNDRRSELVTNTLTDSEMAQLEEVAATGKPIIFTDREISWIWMWLIAVAWLVGLLCAGPFIGYAMYSLDRDESLVDLPWRKPWTWIFMVLTLPIGLPFYLVSFVRFQIFRKEEAADKARRANERAEAERIRQERLAQIREQEAADIRRRAEARAARAATETEDVTADQEATPATEAAAIPVEPKPLYHSSPGAARQSYFDMRNGAWRRRQSARVDELTRSIEDSKAALRTWGESIATEQRRLGEQQTQLKTAEAALAEHLDVLTPEHINEEFSRMVVLPGVTAVQVINDTVAFVVEARFPSGGKVYDLGDWRVSFDPNTGLGYDLRLLRSGLQTGGGTYGRGNDYCFGNRAETITAHIHKGQFLEALALIVEGLNHLNPEERPRVHEFAKEAIA